MKWGKDGRSKIEQDPATGDAVLGPLLDAALVVVGEVCAGDVVQLRSSAGGLPLAGGSGLTVQPL